MSIKFHAQQRCNSITLFANDIIERDLFFVLKMAYFACRANLAKPLKTCIFEGVGRCQDQVAERICNAHCLPFSLLHSTASFENGNNETWSRIVVYATTNQAINIPLFRSADNVTSLEEIRNFSMNVQNNFPEFKAELFAARLECLMAVGDYGTFNNCTTLQSWFNGPHNKLTIRTRDGLKYYKSSQLPFLHKALLSHIDASNVVKMKTNQNNIVEVQGITYQIPTIILTLNDSNNMLAFKVTNGQVLLKKTDKNDNIATPLVLTGVRSINDDETQKTFSFPNTSC